jgi:hypothetical protein
MRSISSQEAPMTAATVHRPTDDPTDQLTGLAVLPTQRAGRPAEPARLRVVPALPEISEPPQTGPTRETGSVQLTRRGRVVVLLVLVAAGVALLLGLTGLVGGAAAGTGPAHPAARTVVVQPGQTLWSIAGEVAPGADRRDTIARIVELNALPSTDVAAGVRIAVPAR